MNDYKVILLGSQSVGKTCITNRYFYNKFGLTTSTIGAS